MFHVQDYWKLGGEDIRDSNSIHKLKLNSFFRVAASPRVRLRGSKDECREHRYYERSEPVMTGHASDPELCTDERE